MHWGELVDGIETRDENDKLFNFIDGKNVFSTHWIETETDKVLDASVDHVNQDAIDDLNAYYDTLDSPPPDDTLPTSADNFGDLITEKIIAFDDSLFTIESRLRPVIDDVEENFLEESLTNIDKWLTTQFQFNNDFSNSFPLYFSCRNFVILGISSLSILL